MIPMQTSYKHDFSNGYNCCFALTDTNCSFAHSHPDLDHVVDAVNSIKDKSIGEQIALLESMLQKLEFCHTFMTKVPFANSNEIAGTNSCTQSELDGEIIEYVKVRLSVLHIVERRHSSRAVKQDSE